MKTDYDLVGIGIGPFHLSLASLLRPLTNLRTKFFDQKVHFSWHREIMFGDSVMQTSYLKDLVTPVDPTNPHSFLNYLVQRGLFYAHMNTGRSLVNRREFELYCQWVSENLGEQLSFNCPVQEVHHRKDHFLVKAGDETLTTKHLSVATGATPWLPAFAHSHLSRTCFHAKSAELASANLADKRVVVVGGGQTGLEVFRNVFQGRWGKPLSTKIISLRHTLEPLDESPFTNEYFTPHYVEQFYVIGKENKEKIIHHQRFASDGNTPFYLQDLYNELYQRRYVDQDPSEIEILPQRKVFAMEKQGETYRLSVENTFCESQEGHEADVVIFCTGLRHQIPQCLDGIRQEIDWDSLGRFQIDQNFSVQWKHQDRNSIYALNFGRHIHGIAEPQTSLMAWRSGIIINHLCGRDVYPAVRTVHNFTQHGVRP